MQLVHVYRNFPGTTDEALRRYASVFRTRDRLGINWMVSRRGTA